MKKTTQTPSTSRPGKRPRQATPPAGLAAAFKMVDMDATAIAAVGHAKQTYPHATRILRILDGHTGRNVDVAVQDELNRATEAMYGGRDRPSHEPPVTEVPDLVSFASFHVGFAVCWLLLTSVNGGTR